MRTPTTFHRVCGARRLQIIYAAHCVLVSAAAGGCSWSSADGTKRTHLVFGFGVVETSTADSMDPSAHGVAASAERVTATGAFLGPGPVTNGLMIGHSERQCVAVSPDAGIVIEARTLKDGRMQVHAQGVTTTRSTEPMSNEP
jgi:hypothetical protein